MIEHAQMPHKTDHKNEYKQSHTLLPYIRSLNTPHIIHSQQNNPGIGEGK
jgi:hypothetical protein